MSKFLDKNVKAALHHWWPHSVSKFWADEKGLVTRISPDGNESRAPPQRFGAINSAHQIVVQDSSDDGAAPFS